MIPRAELDRASRALGEAAIEAARRGELHAARRLLVESTALSDDDPRYLKALGYSAFALGDIPDAYQAWKRAEVLLGGPGIIPWVRSLEHGILRVTVERFNSSLSLVRRARYRDALPLLNRVLDEIPDFVPAGKLKGLALLATGDRIGAHSAWTAQQALCRDDEELERMIALVDVDVSEEVAPDVTDVIATPTTRMSERMRMSALAAAVVIIGLITFWPRNGRETVAADATGSVAPGKQLSDTPTAASPIATAGTKARRPNTVTASRPTHSPPPSQRANFSARYKQGSAAAQRGEWARAIAYLGPVGEIGVDEPFHPHVLALLTQAYISTNRDADARRVARRLIEKYPRSPYITNELRDIAGVGKERK